METRLALMFILPQAKYHFDGEETYENLVWDDLFFVKPTKEEIEIALKYAKMSGTTDYREQRKKYYPSAEEQLQMIFDLGIEKWKERIQNVKNNVPKPQ